MFDACREYRLHGLTGISAEGVGMNIRFISTLTPEDEDSLAPGLVAAVGCLLDQFPIPYTIRIETTGSKVFQHTHPASETPLPASPSRASTSSL
jgi:hypothetical protein